MESWFAIALTSGLQSVKLSFYRVYLRPPVHGQCRCLISMGGRTKCLYRRYKYFSLAPPFA